MDERKRVHCIHCGEFVSKKTFLAHKRIYYDSDSDQWIKKKELDPENEFAISTGNGHYHAFMNYFNSENNHTH